MLVYNSYANWSKGVTIIAEGPDDDFYIIDPSRGDRRQRKARLSSEGAIDFKGCRLWLVNCWE